MNATTSIAVQLAAALPSARPSSAETPELSQSASSSSAASPCSSTTSLPGSSKNDNEVNGSSTGASTPNGSGHSGSYYNNYYHNNYQYHHQHHKNYSHNGFHQNHHNHFQHNNYQHHYHNNQHSQTSNYHNYNGYYHRYNNRVYNNGYNNNNNGHITEPQVPSNFDKTAQPYVKPYSSTPWLVNGYPKLYDSLVKMESQNKEQQHVGKYFIDGFPNIALYRVIPDELVKTFKFGEVVERPALLSSEGSVWTSLSEAVWEKFQTNQQTTETFRKKMDLWRDMSNTLRKHYQHYGLQIVGSTMNGFGSNASDVDMCLLIRRVEVDQQSEAIDILHQLWSVFSPKPAYLEKIEMVYAKVPLLKCRDSGRNLEVDLNCNNYVGIRNTNLLYCYAQQDWRLKPLVLIVKLWAKFHDINDAKSMTISSYSWTLMVIHFLQCGVSPPVLPCLHKLFTGKFTYYTDILTVRHYMNENIPIEVSDNKQTLGDLLVKFFEYYAMKFDYKGSAISVRLGTAVPISECQRNKAPKNDIHQWKQLCIEEPFDYTNTARSVYCRDAFDRIRGIIFASWQRIYFSRDLESIFSPISAYEARQIGVRIRC